MSTKQVLAGLDKGEGACYAGVAGKRSQSSFILSEQGADLGLIKRIVGIVTDYTLDIYLNFRLGISLLAIKASVLVIGMIRIFTLDTKERNGHLVLDRLAPITQV